MVEYESLEEFEKILDQKVIHKVAVQSLDFSSLEEKISAIKFEECLFLGCDMSPHLLDHLKTDNYIFPKLKVPYNIYPNGLYSKESLYTHYDRNNPSSYQLTLDKIVYDHFIKTGIEAKSIHETLARWLHDHSITDAVYDFLDDYDDRKVVAMMGGHSLSRADRDYTKVALISKHLTEQGYLMISGGGPGAMEATHVGTWFAGMSDQRMKNGIKILKTAPSYKDKNWLSTAFEVIEKYKVGPFRSLGIPTWLYGHEPPTPFATHIAKYFANSVREEGLLAVAKGGIIFAPGSAGTMQEIFQEVAQNHYESFGKASPMVFMNKKYWTKERPVFPVILGMQESGALNNLDLGLYNREEEIIQHIKESN